MSAGPVRSGRVGWLGHFTVPGPDGGRGPAGAAGEGGAWSPSAPPAGSAARSVGVLPGTGSHRRLPTAAASCAKPVFGGVATARNPPPKLPEAQLQADQRHPVGADQLID